jgi:hypothetical protein
MPPGGSTDPHARRERHILVSMMRATLPAQFELSIDDDAVKWLDDRPHARQLFIAFMSSQACCSGGAQICDVRVRIDANGAQRDARGASWVTLGLVNGREVMMDSRLVGRMPERLRFVQRGIGPFRHLDLDLSSEQWADALYPVAR